MAVDLLHNRTWRDLRATARMHGVHFDHLWTRPQAVMGMRRQLLADNRLQKTLGRLGAHEREALMALKAHNGRMVRHVFTRAYGAIRPYRPWRDDSPPNPWRRPISIAEKLWFLGLIEVQQHQAILLPQSVSALLPHKTRALAAPFRF